MRKNNVTELVQPGEFKDQLTEILRQGARALVLQAVEAEFASFLQSHEHERMAVNELSDTGICQKGK